MSSHHRTVRRTTSASQANHRDAEYRSSSTLTRGPRPVGGISSTGASKRPINLQSSSSLASTIWSSSGPSGISRRWNKVTNIVLVILSGFVVMGMGDVVYMFRYVLVSTTTTNESPKLVERKPPIVQEVRVDGIRDDDQSKIRGDGDDQARKENKVVGLFDNPIPPDQIKFPNNFRSFDQNEQKSSDTNRGDNNDRESINSNDKALLLPREQEMGNVPSLDMNQKSGRVEMDANKADVPDDDTEDSDDEEDSENFRPSQNATLAGKERILALIKEAGVSVDDELIAKLPTWDKVVAMYGDQPVVYGLEQCERFQNETGDPADHFLSVAGTFNTGTNLMAELLIHNCHLPAKMRKYGSRYRGVRWQVLWGKHTPVGDEDFRLNHRTYKEDALDPRKIFPVVTVRDPFKWMQSMCRHNYAAHWKYNTTHCPNLIPNAADLLAFPDLTSGVPPRVRVHYSEFNKYHTSLAHFWNDWYNDYVHAPFPRLIVRFEDAIFHPKLLTKIACECAGGRLNKGRFRYEVESAKRGKAHGTEKTSYVDALIKYGTEQGRYNGFEPADLKYAVENLDSKLMDSFGYKFPEEPS